MQPAPGSPESRPRANHMFQKYLDKIPPIQRRRQQQHKRTPCSTKQAKPPTGHQTHSKPPSTSCTNSAASKKISTTAFKYKVIQSRPSKPATHRRLHYCRPSRLGLQTIRTTSTTSAPTRRLTTTRTTARRRCTAPRTTQTKISTADPSASKSQPTTDMAFKYIGIVGPNNLHFNRKTKTWLRFDSGFASSSKKTKIRPKREIAGMLADMSAKYDAHAALKMRIQRQDQLSLRPEWSRNWHCPNSITSQKAPTTPNSTPFAPARLPHRRPARRLRRPTRYRRMAQANPGRSHH